MDPLNHGLKVNFVRGSFQLAQHSVHVHLQLKWHFDSPCSRTNGECCCPIQCSSEANSTSANGQALSCSSFCAASCFPCHAPSNSVPRSTRLAPSHDASPEAEPHNSHSKTSWAGPSGDPPGKRVPVREARGSWIKSAFAALFCLLYLNFKSTIIPIA